MDTSSSKRGCGEHGGEEEWKAGMHRGTRATPEQAHKKSSGPSTSVTISCLSWTVAYFSRRRFMRRDQSKGLSHALGSSVSSLGGRQLLSAQTYTSRWEIKK